MGVIYVVAEAAKLGFSNGDPRWCNLGQGQPEVGPIDGAPARVGRIQLEAGDHAYGPVNGTLALRTAVANHYNRLYRSRHASKYVAQNVAISAGGRLALSRLLATLGNVRVGYQVPDYTAFEDMLAAHRGRIVPVALRTNVADGFVVGRERLERAIIDNRLDAHLFSNPCNPTGQVVAEGELRSYLEIARHTGCWLLCDEFYSHFVYQDDGTPAIAPISSADFVDDIERDPVLIVDGLTKNFRYPGWRIGWIVGPSDVIEQVTRSASAIDGGPPVAMQHAAVQVLSPDNADRETTALRAVFARKRKLMLDSLRSLGVDVAHPPRGTFYVWGSIANLPPPYDDAEQFFRAALNHRVLLVPGRFFDVNPGAERPVDPEYQRWVRFSFGPPEQNVRLGLQRLADLLRHPVSA